LASALLKLWRSESNEGAESDRRPSRLVLALLAFSIPAVGREALIQAAASFQEVDAPASFEMKPGRNDPCPCGSGTKFKNIMDRPRPCCFSRCFSCAGTRSRCGRRCETAFSQVGILADARTDRRVGWPAQIRDRESLSTMVERGQHQPGEALSHLSENDISVLEKWSSQLRISRRSAKAVANGTCTESASRDPKALQHLKNAN
jgi:hypothetical protein